MSPQSVSAAENDAHASRPTERPGFRSGKTIGAISYPQRWHRDLLIQATLDPAVAAIEQATSSQRGQDPFEVFVWFGGQRRRLIAVREASDFTMPCATDTMVLARSFVLSEPRCSTARGIWACRNTPVSHGDRFRILGLLDQHSSGLPLRRLMECVRSETAESVDIVLAVICAGQAEVEIRSPLSPDITVRLRRGQSRPLPASAAAANPQNSISISV
ncbi:hypothetical protein [Methylobacterium haplocladii]|uniref:Uncharacterized protein n=1 Tax=Methylobacterium haplocladii TaxID=1176176 RepID=A0A512IUX9_9HYPH|nr:hypothetical protein [Methylobacterium haplocladii]GEP01515.1 hypothetical protein MHA02_39020 [Methylobacterium haplocladii]GJD82299.1 hypothetical protein HPGCJGGD_0151 [Methylobacterium haplocladii]GLS59166.1 hypothetical protein GCM10007887_18320 [Methylobacterium haplocladii]